MQSGIDHGLRPTTLSTRWSAEHRRAQPWTPPPVPTLVVVPHPDDEVLAFGLLLARQRAGRVPITIVAVTDGEAAYPGDDAGALAATRRDEQGRALDALGVTGTVVRLGLPDGAVSSHEDDLAAFLGGVIAEGRAGHHPLVVAPWTADHHPDHDACGRAAVRAVGDTGATLVHGLFWAWHRGGPDELADRQLLALTGDHDELATRDRAVRCHTSQFASARRTDPVLTERDLEPHTWTTEYYVLGRGRRP